MQNATENVPMGVLMDSIRMIVPKPVTTAENATTPESASSTAMKDSGGLAATKHVATAYPAKSAARQAAVVVPASAHPVGGAPTA